MSSTSSDVSDASAPRTRRSARLSADRGVIPRASYAATSETESDTDTEVDVAQDDDDSDDVPLAQREEADESDEETEDEHAVVKQEPLSDGDSRVKMESMEQEHGSDDSESEDESDEEEEGNGSHGDGSDGDDDDDAISIKSEQDDNRTLATTKEESDEDESEADESEYTRSDSDGVKSEEEDDGVAVAKATTSVSDASSDDDSVEEEADDSRATHASRGNGEVGGEEEEKEEEEEENYEDEDEVEYEEEEDEGEAIQRSDMDEAKRLLDRIAHTHLPQSEQVALHRRKDVTGPPMDFAISQADQWKRKYRWPVAMRNVRRRKFIANADELATDHQMRLVQPASSASATARSAFAAALAPTARPLMEAAVAVYRDQKKARQQEMNFVDRLEDTAEADPDAVNATRLRAQTRLGGHFTDQLLDSILVKNVLALQGIDASYAQQCWDPLPTSKRPVANWRFVLEHFCRTMMHGVDAASINSAPRLRKDTLIRIRDRLRTLYGVSWRSEDDAFFDLVDQQDIDPPEPSELIRL